MLKLFSTLLLVLTLVLLPPAALAVVSNNALPGQPTYPIKRALEKGILAVASINPTTKAWFSINVSGRRLNEATALIASGQNATDSLDELVSQTNLAAQQIQQVDNINQKQQLAADLSSSIQKYKQKLQTADVKIQTTQTAIATKPSSTTAPATGAPTKTDVQVPQILASPTPAAVHQAKPTPSVAPTPSPIAVIVATPSPVAQTAAPATTTVANHDGIIQAIDGLDKIEQEINTSVMEDKSGREKNDKQSDNQDQQNHPKPKGRD